MKERLALFGDAPMPTTPMEFGKLMTDEAEKWGKVIRVANINGVRTLALTLSST